MRKTHELHHFSPLDRPDGSFFLAQDGESLHYRTLFRDAAFFHQQHRQILGYQLSLIATMQYQHTEPRGFVPPLQAHQAESMLLVFDTRNVHEGWYRYHVAAGYGTRQYSLSVGEHGLGFGKEYQHTPQNAPCTQRLLDPQQATALMGMIYTMRSHPLTRQHLQTVHETAEQYSDQYDKIAEVIQPDAPVETWVGLSELRRKRFLTEASWVTNFAE